MDEMGNLQFMGKPALQSTWRRVQHLPSQEDRLNQLEHSEKHCLQKVVDFQKIVGHFQKNGFLKAEMDFGLRRISCVGRRRLHDEALADLLRLSGQPGLGRLESFRSRLGSRNRQGHRS